MPPKKKQRLPSRGPSTPSTGTPAPLKTPLLPSSTKLPIDESTLLADPWTDEQETALFKGIMRFKPVGMHKHFRMISLYNYIHSTGCTSQADKHTTIAGIWEKLGLLYNLPILDERENALPPTPPDDPSVALYHPFSLSEAEFGPMMFERRFAVSPSTPPVSDRGTESRMASTVEGTDEPRNSLAGRRLGRSGRTGGRATRKVEASVTEADGEEEMEEAGEEGGEDGEEGGETEEGTENAEEEDVEGETRPALRRGKGGRVRGVRGSRRKRGR